MESNHVTYFQRVVSAPIDLPGITFGTGGRTRTYKPNTRRLGQNQVWLANFTTPAYYSYKPYTQQKRRTFWIRLIGFET